MIFRFSKYPDVELHKSIKNRLVGFKHIDQRPTSVEITHEELKQLMRTESEVSLLEIACVLEQKD